MLNAFGLFARAERDWRSSGSIELLGEARDNVLEQLVRVAKQRFGAKRATLLGTRAANKGLAQLAAERGLEIAQERQR